MEDLKTEEPKSGFTWKSELRVKLDMVRAVEEGVNTKRTYGEICLEFVRIMDKARFEGQRSESLWSYGTAYLDGYLDAVGWKEYVQSTHNRVLVKT